MTRTFSQQDMDDFGVASGGTGLIHTEPEFAAATPFGKTLVQGVYLLAVIEKELYARVPEWAARGSLEVKFVSPVTEGTPFTVEITDVDGGWEILAATPAGPAVVGAARLRPA
ncbi:MaoC family dehydratase [Pseudonocardia bannensis]|uniref:MaoC family dehydratase n=1 Tax=Pseudonocardia bannensis TaxID=630973 RepID=A0A848DPE5_9PSEU|nr:MaoC family dehydratase [Pseudonocardia bannensis]NMH94379.1 MaoC family dehydratase [Pseudonocardia bannensis]